MRIIAIVLDEPTNEVRNKEVTEMLNYAFSGYEIGTIISENQVLKKVDVEKSLLKNVGIIPLKKVTYLKNKLEEKPNVKYEVDIKKIVAPVKKGDVVGTIKVEVNNNYEMIKLTVSEDVNRLTFLELLTQKLKLLLI